MTVSPATRREIDEHWLRRCLVIAAQGRYTVSPNPMVGAVVVKDGKRISEGYHRRVGGPHAEREAFAGLTAEETSGATLYVSLEPCAHQGRTPPCIDAVLEAGIARVVSCQADPNEAVSGRSFQRLREAGVEVDLGLLAEDAARLNLAFLTRHALGRPAVTLKWAMSLDGRIATSSGESQWISSPAGRDWALDLREEHDAILVGSGTALADDPRLDRRRGLAEGPICRVVLDRRLRIGGGAALFSVGGPVIVFTGDHDPEAMEPLRNAGAEVVPLAEPSPSNVLEELAARDVQSVLVEGGGEILAAFADEGLFDRVEVCCAPKLIGGESAPGPLRGAGVQRLADSEVLESLVSRVAGPDLIVSAIRRGAVSRLLSAGSPPT
ncbi:MAG: bifunctional diaminohydroxyphosphoribosylaminopyrimidine deaminase/5-amino-6-(5-phosphoribosylamino)uracil reductase RibD [Acidobacteriota bacterium]